MTVAIVTGGARGSSRAIARELAGNGIRAAVGDIDGDLAAVEAATLSGAVGRRLDVTDAAGFATFVDEVRTELGPVDVLVNNVGIMPISPFEDQDAGLDRRVFARSAQRGPCGAAGHAGAFLDVDRDARRAYDRRIGQEGR